MLIKPSYGSSFRRLGLVPAAPFFLRGNFGAYNSAAQSRYAPFLPQGEYAIPKIIVWQKNTGSFPPIHFALYHIGAALSIKYERMFVFYFFNFKNPCSKALPAKVFSPTEKATLIYFPDLSSLTIFPSPNLACRTISPSARVERTTAGICSTRFSSAMVV